MTGAAFTPPSQTPVANGDAERLSIVDPDRLILLTTWDYLRLLEGAQRIQSAQAVIDAVQLTGRNPPTRDPWTAHDPEIRDAVRKIIARTHESR